MLLISLTLLLYILAMELSLHQATTHPGALITNPTSFHQSTSGVPYIHALLTDLAGLGYKRDSRPLNNGNFSANDLDRA